MDASALLAAAGAKAHLEREKAFVKLEAAMDDGAIGCDAPEALDAIQQGALAMLRSEEWEHRLGGLRVAKVLITKGAASETFQEDAIHGCVELLEDREVRVRWAVGELLRALTERRGIAVWEQTRGRILGSIERNFERDNAEPSSAPPPSAPADPVVALLQQAYRPEAPGSGDMRHGTEGWKCLETSFRALQHVMEGAGAAFGPHLDAPLRATIYRALLHPNRFVREACHFIMGSVCRLLEGPRLAAAAPEIASKLGLGLSDNWSQVRFASSTATRALMECLGPEGRGQALPLLVPHMCLNRYYVAEGVRLYSQETWKLVMGDSGREWVAACAPQVVSYYVEQSKANNHAVREAACACIAELMCKVDRGAVAPHVPRLLRALLACFKDASWPVRDAACLACGRCVRAFPQESREVVEELYSLWFAHLWDNIASVREDSAVALGDAVRAYGDEASARVAEQLRTLLPMARDQAPDSRAAAGMENATLFGVAASRGARANDADLHTDKTMFSCGSLAPKLQRGGGCVDHGFARDKEPWEATDGGIYMVRELAAVAPAAALEFLPALADAARLTHFAHCLTLQETLWRALPAVAAGLGKKAFKPHLDQFIDPMFRGLTCGHRLCEAAAGQCIASMRDLIGPGIFAGRLTPEQREAMAASADVPPPAGALSGVIGAAAVLPSRAVAGVA